MCVQGVSGELREVNVRVSDVSVVVDGLRERVVMCENTKKCECEKKNEQIEEKLRREILRREACERTCKRMERSMMEMERRLERMERRDRKERGERDEVERVRAEKRKKGDEMRELYQMVRRDGGGSGVSKRQKRD